MEEERAAAVRGVIAGQFTKNLTFLDNAVNLESSNWVSTPSTDAVHVSRRRKTIGSEIELGSIVHRKSVAFEIGDGSDEESKSLRHEVGRGNAGKSCLSSGGPEKTLTEFGLSEMEMMARAKAGTLGFGAHVASNSGMVHVPTVGSSGELPDVGLL